MLLRAASIEAVKTPINALRKVIIMDLLKILFFVFKLAWKLLLAVGAVFLWLLSLLPDNEDESPEPGICDSLNCNSFNSSQFNRSSFNSSGEDWRSTIYGD
jgi:hypothetical protein